MRNSDSSKQTLSSSSTNWRKIKFAETRLSRWSRRLYSKRKLSRKSSDKCWTRGFKMSNRARTSWAQELKMSNRAKTSRQRITARCWRLRFNRSSKIPSYSKVSPSTYLCQRYSWSRKTRSLWEYFTKWLKARWTKLTRNSRKARKGPTVHKYLSRKMKVQKMPRKQQLKAQTILSPRKIASILLSTNWPRLTKLCKPQSSGSKGAKA